jgi:hypothetical protein
MGSNKLSLVALTLASALLCVSKSVTAADPPTRESIAKLSPEEKNALLKKKERFDALPPAEQDRLRTISAAISSASNSDQLHATLDRYHEWLKTLSSKQLAQLLDLPMEERIKQIKELMEQQEKDRLRALARNELPEPDIEAIFTWLEEFMKEHEEDYLKRVHKDYADKLRQQDEVSRRRSLMRSILSRGPRNDYPLPMNEDLDRLLRKLSQPTRDAVQSFKTPEEKQELARRWIFQAMVSKVLPPASEEDLQKILESMSESDRAKLEAKTSEEMKRELTQRFHWQNWPGREGYRGGGGPGFSGGPFGFRPGGSPPGSPGTSQNGPGPGPNGSGRGPGAPPPKRDGGRGDSSRLPMPMGTRSSSPSALPTGDDP